jgi:hypothetical protein
MWTSMTRTTGSKTAVGNSMYVFSVAAPLNVESWTLNVFRNPTRANFQRPTLNVQRSTFKGQLLGTSLTRIFHTRIEQRSGGGVIRLDSTKSNETAIHRFFFDRL